MTSIICTCSKNRRLVLNPFAKPEACPIHGDKNSGRMETTPDAFVQDVNGYLLVCLCRDDCDKCKYTPLSQLIKQGIKVRPFFVDEKGERHEIQISYEKIPDTKKLF